ncbi:MULTISPECIES: mannose-1-phosphate guanylyltransferase [Geobacter]|uniref:mannose-1-phosphate guanylyltransferase n=2 Tax=Geobacter TaxID=28231 RepID=A0A0C1TPK0_9BACT|nr:MULTISPECIES: mannose-1-phosphate guanylyltransferase [Geobacter]KIE42759.1 mannose-1-phosphate guanylyltransferase [Geobacter soli]MBE2888333.1 mannose-1-phosphate guanylyltransferase [Geobacter anodireducens]HMN03548.1 mannose-1-phosphate guanylyltransferase [Geobacter anodireducens]
MYVVILAGGSGTRFWPLSRKAHPKQLMSVFGGKSMLQRTVERVIPLNPKRILVVTNHLQADETRRQLEYLRGMRIEVIEEPMGRNTAPAICLAATLIARHDPEAVMAVLPADHYIADEDGFCAALQEGRNPAMNGWLVTFGILPDRPETGYGYIEADRDLRGDGPYPVKRFVEKPDAATAAQYLAAGGFYWNSGMFMWRVDVILDRIANHMPDLARAFAGIAFDTDIWEPADLAPQIEAVYAMVPGQSIDYGVMEKADNVLVLPASFGWSDVGSWSALPGLIAPDDDGTIRLGHETVISVDSAGCVVRGEKLVALVGVRDLVVVDTPDALMVCAKDGAQDVRKIVEDLERRGLKQYL